MAYGTWALGEPFFWLTARRSGRAPAPLEARRVLVVKLDEIGDVVLSSGSLRELRRALPAARITLVVKPATRELVEKCPHVDEVLTFDPRYRERLGLLRRHFRAIAMGVGQLWGRRFDLAVVPRVGPDWQNALYLAYFSGARLRVGYAADVDADRAVFNAGTDVLLTHRAPGCPDPHEAQRNAALLRFLGVPVLSDRLETWPDEADCREADRLLAEAGIGPDDEWIALGIGAGAQRRVWPAERYAALAAGLLDRPGRRVVLIGGPGDRAAGQTIARDKRIVDLTGRMTLRQTAAALRRCRLFIGNNSGPMHLAAASGATVLEISCHAVDAWPEHENSPRRFGPWGPQSRVVQPAHQAPPCTGGCQGTEPHCILQVTVEEVLQAARAMLAGDVV